MKNAAQYITNLAAFTGILSGTFVDTLCRSLRLQRIFVYLKFLIKFIWDLNNLYSIIALHIDDYQSDKVTSYIVISRMNYLRRKFSERDEKVIIVRTFQVYYEQYFRAAAHKSFASWLFIFLDFISNGAILLVKFLEYYMKPHSPSLWFFLSNNVFISKCH